MKKKMLVAVATAGLLLGGVNVAVANNGNGAPFGPDGINEGHPAWYGLCTAYYSGNGDKQGAPFQALEDHFDGDEDAIADFCRGIRPSNGQGKGKQDDSSAPSPVD